jgi:hypothetical protein
LTDWYLLVILCGLTFQRAQDENSMCGVVEIRAWLWPQTDAGVAVYVSETVDYEVRRELLRRD